MRSKWLLVAFGLALASPSIALAAESSSNVAGAAAVELPANLSLEVALRIFRAHGFDLLLANARVASAVADVHSASAIANPTASVGAGPAFNYDARDTPSHPCPGCQAYAVQWGLSDSGALADSIVGKRSLRVDVARKALAAARLDRKDAERQLVAQVKIAYVSVALAQEALVFAQDVATTLAQALDLAKLRYPAVIDEGDLARIEVQKLSADQSLDSARSDVRQAQVALATLLGVRGRIPSFSVDRSLTTYSVPSALQATTEQALFERAIASRPDLASAVAQMRRAAASLALAERQRVPDIALFAQYSQLGMGQNVGQPMNLVVGVNVGLPVFYQQQGEIARALADRDAQSIAKEKTVAQIASDVASAWSSFQTSRALVERMRGSLLERARKARDVTDVQYKNGGATLMDFLDAQRTFIATNVDYIDALSAYWTSVYQLEQALGAEFQ